MSGIEVGDRVTYRINQTKTIRTVIIEDTDTIKVFNDTPSYEILKIERPSYEVIEEKKELLTEEEKEIIRTIKQSIKDINFIMKIDDCIYFYETEDSGWKVSISDMKNFKNLEQHISYKLEGLDLESEEI